MWKGLSPTSEFFNIDVFLKENEDQLLEAYNQIEYFFISESLEETDEAVGAIANLTAAHILSGREEISWPIPVDPVDEDALRELGLYLFIFFTEASLRDKGLIFREDNIFDVDQTIEFTVTEKGAAIIEESKSSQRA